MSSLDKVTIISPAYGFAKKALEENPEAAKKMKNAIKTGAKAAVGATQIGLLYNAGKYVSEHPEEVKQALKNAGKAVAPGLTYAVEKYPEETKALLSGGLIGLLLFNSKKAE